VISICIESELGVAGEWGHYRQHSIALFDVKLEYLSNFIGFDCKNKLKWKLELKLLFSYFHYVFIDRGRTSVG
jgi:hypothetical protein